MEIQIRDVAEDDLPVILELNEQAIPLVNCLEIQRFRWFARSAAYFRVAETDQKIAGFLIAITPATDYDSQYFGWFCQRYASFLYVDRIVITEWARRRGVGFALYNDLEDYALGLSYSLAADVYSDPPNEISLTFHAKYGFEQVGTQIVEEDDGAHQVAKFLKQPGAKSIGEQA